MWLNTLNLRMPFSWAEIQNSFTDLDKNIDFIFIGSQLFDTYIQL